MYCLEKNKIVDSLKNIYGTLASVIVTCRLHKSFNFVMIGNDSSVSLPSNSLRQLKQEISLYDINTLKDR